MRVYHGTSASQWERIRTEGLRNDMPENQRLILSLNGYVRPTKHVYFFSNPSQARLFAKLAGYFNKSGGVIIETNIPKRELDVDSSDFLSYWIKKLTGKPCISFKFKGHVPPNRLKVIGHISYERIREDKKMKLYNVLFLGIF